MNKAIIATATILSLAGSVSYAFAQAAPENRPSTTIESSGRAAGAGINTNNRGAQFNKPYHTPVTVGRSVVVMPNGRVRPRRY